MVKNIKELEARLAELEEEGRTLYNKDQTAWREVLNRSLALEDAIKVCTILEQSGIDHERFQTEMPDAFEAFKKTYEEKRRWDRNQSFVGGIDKMFAAVDYENRVAVLCTPTVRQEYEVHVDTCCDTFHGVFAAYKTWYHYGTEVEVVTETGRSATQFVEHWNDEQMHEVGCDLKPARFDGKLAYELNENFRPKQAAITNVSDDAVTVELYGGERPPSTIEVTIKR